VCYNAWATKEAYRISERLKEASKRFGLVEHIVCSVPVKDYGSSNVVLRGKVMDVLKSLGVIGGNLIFHGFRYNDFKKSRVKSVPLGWYWSPHFHVLGFVLGGYKCRGCERKSNCLKGCGGFDDKRWQLYKKCGYYVKVFRKRKKVYAKYRGKDGKDVDNVFGTAWYQLNHSSYRKDAKRFHVSTWFGVCSYRKLKVTVERKKDLCPACGHELELCDYHGRKVHVFDRDSPDYVRDSFENFLENCQVVWSPRISGYSARYHGGLNGE